MVSPGARSGGKFVISMAGEAYDARDRGLDRKLRIKRLNVEKFGRICSRLNRNVLVKTLMGDAYHRYLDIPALTLWAMKNMKSAFRTAGGDHELGGGNCTGCAAMAGEGYPRPHRGENNEVTWFWLTHQ